MSTYEPDAEVTVEALRASELCYRRLFESAKDGILILDAETGMIVDVNPFLLGLLGISREACLGKKVWELGFFNDIAANQDKFAELQAQEYIRYKDLPLETADGRPIAVEFVSNVCLVSGRRVIQCNIRDITDRRRMEEQLQEQAETYRTLIEQVSDSIALVDSRGGRFVEFNLPAHRNLGYTREEFEKLTVADIDVGIRPENIMGCLAATFQKGSDVFESCHRHKSGQFIDVRVSVKSLYLRGREYFAAIWSDITERKQAEQALVERESRLCAILDATPFPVALVDVQDNNIDFWSRSALTLFGHIAPTAAKWYELAYPDPDYRREVIERWKPLLEKARQSGQVINTGQYQITCSNGSVRLCELYAAFVVDRLVITIDDITEREQAATEKAKLEAQLQHVQKIESLGVLAGGIAHDFNNILQGILGNATLVLMDLAEPSPARICVEDILKASRRAAELTRQLLAYSGRGHFIIQQVEVSALVREMANLIAVSISKKTILNLNLTPVLITADVTQLQQIVMNLILNASEALDEENGGKVTVATGMQRCTRDYLEHSRLPEKPPRGNYGYIDVSDTGCGMDSAILEKLFDPFFTTKSTGRGLGMSAVLGIVRGHNGGIMVHSAPGKGTTIRVLFPASAEPAAKEPSQTKSITAWKGTGTVLFVDDEEGVQRIGKSMLERLSFKVLLASDGLDALDVYHRFSNEIVCIVLDLSMPRMDGEQTLKQLRLAQHDVPVVLSSGFSEIQLTEQFAGQQVTAFIKKPYDFQSLSDLLQSILP